MITYYDQLIISNDNWSCEISINYIEINWSTWCDNLKLVERDYILAELGKCTQDATIETSIMAFDGDETKT